MKGGRNKTRKKKMRTGLPTHTLMSLLDGLMRSMDEGREQLRLVQQQRVQPTSEEPVTVEAALRQWHAMRRSEYGMTVIDYAHMCTRQHCILSESIQVIEPSLRLYGCLNSGVYHLCNQDTGCSVCYTSRDGGIFCMFSMYFIETWIDASKFGMVMPVKDFYIGPTSRPDNVPQESGVSSSSSWSEVLCGDAPPEEDGKRVEFAMRVVEPERDMETVAEATNVEVRAIIGDCGAEGEGGEGEGKELPRIAFNAPSLHLMQRQSTDVGGVSRLLAPTEYLTRYTSRDIAKIIETLFNVNYRRQLAQQFHGAAETTALDDLCRYYRLCAETHARPNAHVRDSICHVARSEEPVITQPGRLAAERLAQFKAFVYELWRVMLATPHFTRFPNKFRLINHVVGALYMLREPFSLAAADGTVFEEILPRDEFLFEHLPAQSQLRDWNVRTSVFSSSRVLAVKGVVRGRIDFGKTGVSSGRNVIKEALLSIETDDERWYVVDRLRTAYERGTYEDDSIVYYTT